MPDSYRDRKRQEAWIKAEASRQVAQERADALTELGVPCAQRSGWVVLLDPVGLRIKLDWNPYIERRRKIVRHSVYGLIIAGALLVVARIIYSTNLTVGI